jgi:hypothetical protein
MPEQGLAAVGKPEQAGVEARQVLGDVAQISAQDDAGVVVARHVHHLRQIDDGGPLGGHQHVVGRQIGVHPPGLQQSLDLQEDLLVKLGGLGRSEREVCQAPRRRPRLVHHQLHEQHVLVQEEGLGHAHPGVEGRAQGPELHVLPALLQQAAAVAGLVVHGAAVAGVARLVPPLDVAGDLLERAVIPGPVDFGRTQVAGPLHHVHGRFLAAHQSGMDSVDHPFFNEVGELLYRFHPRATCHTPGKRR